MRTFAVFLLAAALPAAAFAQQPHPTVSNPSGISERMAPFTWLVGEWRGRGWFAGPDGTRRTFESRETVASKLSGNALLVEGRHHATGHPDRIVHDAIAMITWDNRANVYRFRTALANGMGGDYAIEPTANGFTWRIDTPAGPIVYTVTHENGVWTERGRRMLPNGQSADFFEMTLRRHPPAN